MIDVELLSAGSRALTYVGSVAVAGAVLWVVTQPPVVNVDELRLSAS